MNTLAGIVGIAYLLAFALAGYDRIPISDWLASYFVEHGWSVKQIHRVIMLSTAYQRSSKPPAANPDRIDPENNLLSHFSPRRLEAEELRDTILSVAGELSADSGGPGTYSEMNEDVGNQPQQIMGTLMPAYRPSATRNERNRRTIPRPPLRKPPEKQKSKRKIPRRTPA